MIRLDIDQMLPVQFHAPASADTPERRLMLAVFEEAVHGLKTPSVSNRTGAYATKCRNRIQQEAYEWIVDDDEQWPFSFRNCCAQLGFDPEATRQRLLRSEAPAIAIKARYRGSLTVCGRRAS